MPDGIFPFHPLLIKKEKMVLCISYGNLLYTPFHSEITKLQLNQYGANITQQSKHIESEHICLHGAY